ncbi:CAP domain-containing protein [Burkholderia gladioli]|uniref:CAP domain-containing protein n=1 Tax=Burkholderia gladioli TaxID=28095 RepID=UPI001FC7EB84|nr:CAP domain-containing protein [Burkholderia gladioli]
MKKTTFAAAIAAAALAACGGGDNNNGSASASGAGGGNASAGGGATAGGTGASTSTGTSASAIALVSAPGAGAAGSFTATGDVATDAVSYLNNLRIQAGLPALAIQSGVAQAAQAHSSWEQLNNVVGHYETAGTTGYTGYSPSDRVNLHYTTSSVGEVTAGLAGAFTSSTEAAQALFDAPFHRAVMLYDSANAGAGSVATTSLTQYSTLTIDFADYKQFLADNQLVAWPYAGMTGANTSWFANESPNPMPAQYQSTTVGYPVTLTGGGNASFSNVSFAIKDASGNNVPCQEVDSSNNSEATREAMCVPFAPLAVNTTYTVSVSGSLANTSLAATPFSLSWQFTTAATANTPVGAPTGTTPTTTSATSASGAQAFKQTTPARSVVLN